MSNEIAEFCVICGAVPCVCAFAASAGGTDAPDGAIADAPNEPGGAKWRPIETAPKGKMVLAYGQPQNIDGLTFTGPGIHTAYWDEVDEAWCLSSATWIGPFIEPTHWMPLPDPPPVKVADRQPRSGVSS